MAFVVISLVVVAIGLYYAWLVKTYDYWKKKGVPGPKPSFLFGNLKKTITRKLSMGEEFTNLYNDSKKLPYMGVFMLQKPTLVVNNLEMIKSIFTRDFVHFSDRGFQINTKIQPLTDHLFHATGSRWKNMRVKMTPTFTSSKMKEMFDSVSGCAKEMLNHLDERVQDHQISNVKDLMGNFNTDVIGTCAFGIECNSFKNPNAEFRTMGKKIVNLSFWRSIVVSLLIFAPKILWHLKLGLHDRQTNDFFYNTVKDALEHRKKNGIVRKDFLQILMEMLKEDEKTVKPG